MKTYPDHRPTAYVGFATFLSSLDHLRQSSLTEPLEPVDCGAPSKATWNQLTQTFRFLQLIDDDNLPTASLRLLVQPEKRKSSLQTLLKRHYPDLFSTDLPRLTSKRLEHLLARRGIHGATLRRAKSFFVGAARYSGITLSSEVSRGARRHVRRPPRRTSVGNIKEHGSQALLPPDSLLNKTVSVKLQNFQFSFSFPADFLKLPFSDRQQLYRYMDEAIILSQRLNEQATKSGNRSTDVTELDVDNLSTGDEAIH